MGIGVFVDEVDGVECLGFGNDFWCVFGRYEGKVCFW